jgi:hypothetical protein
MATIAKRIGLAVLALAALLFAAFPAVSQDRQRLRLGEASFEAPSGWTLVHRSRDRSYTLKSPDGVYELRVEWWRPDEPLLGFSDIVWHRKIVVADQPALLIHSAFPETQTLQVALDRPRADGRQLLFVLEGKGVDLSNGSPLLDEVLMRLRLGPDRQGAAPTAPSPSLAPPPSPALPASGATADAGRRSTATALPSGAGLPARETVHEDRDGGFSVRYPASWSRSTGRRDGLSILTLTPPDRAGLVLVVAARAANGRSAREAIAAYEDQFYQDSVVPDDIESDGETRLGGKNGRFVAMAGQIHSIEGVRLSFAQGRSWFFKSDGEPVGHIVAVVHAQNAPEAVTRGLATVATGIVFAASAPPSPPLAVTPPQAPAAAPSVAAPPPAPSPSPPTAATADDGRAKLAASGCSSPALAGWRHPLRDVLDAKGGARLEWVSLCRAGAYPVLGVDFAFDPQGATRDYFGPLYHALSAAAGRRPLALVSTRDAVVVTIAPLADGGIDFDIVPLGTFDVATVPLGETAAPAASSTPAPPAAASTPPTTAADAAGAPVEAQAEPATEEKAAETAILFAGAASAEWREIAMSGGDFKKFARFVDDTLVIDVPRGSVWGKTGLASAKPVVDIPGPLGEEAVALRFTLDPARARNFAAALLPPGKAGEDEWYNHRVRFAVSTKDDGPSELILWSDRREQGRRVLESGVPAELELQLMPDGLVLLTDTGGDVLLQGRLPETIVFGGHHVQVVAHARDRDGPASLALRRITRVTWPFGRVDPSDRTLAPGEQQTSLLFDGEVAHPRLLPFQAHGGTFATHARREPGALVVDVPQGAKWGKVGFFSQDPVVWFDGDGEDAETVVTFAFDPARTTGFVAALTPVSGLDGNDPSNPKILVHWRRTDDGKALYSVASGYDKVADAPTATADAPTDVKFVLRHGEVKLLLPGAREVDVPWRSAATGQGFRLYVYSHPDKAGLPVRMALTGIIVERSAGAPVEAVAGADGAKPLPVRTLFDGSRPGAWDIAAISEDLKAFARIDGGRLVVDVPEKKAQWGKSGVLFRDVVLDLDARIQSTSFGYTLRFDPKITDGVQIMLSPNRVADMWSSRRASVHLIRHREGSLAGHYAVGIDADGYRQWWRPITAERMEADWDGTLTIEIENGALTVRVPGLATVRGADLGLGKNVRLHMVITAHPEKPYGAARMGLVSVTGRWRLPPLTSTLDRWSYVDDAEFDANGFLDDLTRSVDEATSQPPTGSGG